MEVPKNDYFNCNLLVNFPYCGHYTIQFDLYIVDNSDVIWHYLAEKHQIFVKVEEDPNRQKLFAAAMAAMASSNAQAQSSASQQVQQPLQQPLMNNLHLPPSQRSTPLTSDMFDGNDIQSKMEN